MAPARKIGSTRTKVRSATSRSSEKIIGVFIGKAKRRFAVHKKLLFARSTLFQKLHRQGRRAASQKYVVCSRRQSAGGLRLTFCKHIKCVRQASGSKIPNIEVSAWDNIDPAAFEVFREWLYEDKTLRFKSDQSTSAHYKRLIRAHRLGDQIQDFGFQFDVRAALRDNIMTNGLSLPVINLIYKTDSGSMELRKLICDLFNIVGDPQVLDQKSIPHSFLVDMAYLAKVRYCEDASQITSREVVGHARKPFWSNLHASPIGQEVAKTLTLHAFNFIAARLAHYLGFTREP